MLSLRQDKTCVREQRRDGKILSDHKQDDNVLVGGNM